MNGKYVGRIQPPWGRDVHGRAWHAADAVWRATGLEWEERPVLTNFRPASAAPRRPERSSVLVLNVACSLIEQWEERLRGQGLSGTADSEDLLSAARELRRRSDEAARRWRPRDEPGRKLTSDDEWLIIWDGLARGPSG